MYQFLSQSILLKQNIQNRFQKINKMFQSVSKRLNTLINSQYQQRITSHRNTYTSRQPTSRADSFQQENNLKNKNDTKPDHFFTNFAENGQTSIQKQHQEYFSHPPNQKNHKHSYPNSYKEIVQQNPIPLTKYHTHIQLNNNTVMREQRVQEASQMKFISADQGQLEQLNTEQDFASNIVKSIQATLSVMVSKIQQDIQVKFNEKINNLDNRNKQLQQKIKELQQIINNKQQSERNLAQTFDPKYFEKIQIKKRQINQVTSNLQTPKKKETDVKSKLFYTSPIHIAILQSPKEPAFPSLQQSKVKNLNFTTPTTTAFLPKTQSDMVLNNLNNRVRQLQCRNSNINCKCQFLVNNFIRNQQHLLTEIKMLKYNRQCNTEMKTPKNKNYMNS